MLPDTKRPIPSHMVFTFLFLFFCAYKLEYFWPQKPDVCVCRRSHTDRLCCADEFLPIRLWWAQHDLNQIRYEWYTCYSGQGGEEAERVDRISTEFCAHLVRMKTRSFIFSYFLCEAKALVSSFSCFIRMESWCAWRGFEINSCFCCVNAMTMAQSHKVGNDVTSHTHSESIWCAWCAMSGDHHRLSPPQHTLHPRNWRRMRP